MINDAVEYHKYFEQDFPNWTSGNKFIDGFIQESQLSVQKTDQILEWIPYDRLKNIEKFDKGGFSTVYKAIWLDGPIIERSGDEITWSRSKDRKVALKCFDNSSNISEEVLNEWKYHYRCYCQLGYNDRYLIQLYGFTQDPITSNYIMVMKYAEGGSLKKNLPSIVRDKWIAKLKRLYNIISGLDIIHQQDLIHGDFHHGNILKPNSKQNILTISDLGLCRPINNSKKDDIFGVLPFVAPEVLRSNPYTQASDIYSFSMIMWEFTSGIPPFDDTEHDHLLGLGICEGDRPKIVENTPQCYVNLMEKCWNGDPKKRPKTSEIRDIIKNWYIDITDTDIDEESESVIIEFYNADKMLKQEQINNTLSIPTASHPQAYHTSRSLSFVDSLDSLRIKDENNG